jgi:hypothetical protein
VGIRRPDCLTKRIWVTVPRDLLSNKYVCVNTLATVGVLLLLVLVPDILLIGPPADNIRGEMHVEQAL